MTFWQQKTLIISFPFFQLLLTQLPRLYFVSSVKWPQYVHAYTFGLEIKNTPFGSVCMLNTSLGPPLHDNLHWKYVCGSTKAISFKTNIWYSYSCPELFGKKNLRHPLQTRRSICWESALPRCSSRERDGHLLSRFSSCFSGLSVYSTLSAQLRVRHILC